MRGVPQLGIAREPQQRNRRSATLSLEVIDVARDDAAATRSFEGRIRGELHDVGLACQSRSRGAAAEHTGRVDDVRLARALSNERCAANMPNPDAVVPRDGADRIRTRRRRGISSRDDLHLVSTAAQELRNVGRMARGPTDVRRPDAGHDHHSHGSTASG